MNSREVVRRCVRFQSPPRYVYWNWPQICDMVDVFDFFRKDENGFDPWGAKWEVHPEIPTIGIVRDHPIKSRGDLAKVKSPAPDSFASQIKEAVQALAPADRDKYRFIATSCGIWERPQFFRGMDVLFEDFIERPDMVQDMISLCTDFWVALLERLAPIKHELDCLYMFDDWGTQNASMISLAMWQDFFLESYSRITAAAHANNMDFWLHSCGCVTTLIEGFIQANIDLVNPYQSGTCGYEEVASRYAGRIAFMTTVDTQSTLPFASDEQVLAECKKLQKWGTEGGGLIIARYGYDIPDGKEDIVFNYFQQLDLERNKERILA